MKKLLLILLLLPLLSQGQYYMGQKAAGGGGGLPTTTCYYEGDNGATISQWNDLSGNGYHLTQATTANKPTYASPLFTFNNTAPQYFKKASLTLSTPYTLYVIVSFASSSGFAYVYFDDAVSGTPHHILFLNSGALNLSCDGSTAISTTAPASNTLALVRCYFNGTSSEIQVNNGTTVTGSAGTGTHRGNIYVSLDQASGATTIKVEAMYFFPGKPTDATVKSYTTSKWGLP